VAKNTQWQRLVAACALLSTSVSPACAAATCHCDARSRSAPLRRRVAPRSGSTGQHYYEIDYARNARATSGPMTCERCGAISPATFKILALAKEKFFNQHTFKRFDYSTFRCE